MLQPPYRRARPAQSTEPSNTTKPEKARLELYLSEEVDDDHRAPCQGHVKNVLVVQLH